MPGTMPTIARLPIESVEMHALAGTAVRDFADGEVDAVGRIVHCDVGQRERVVSVACRLTGPDVSVDIFFRERARVPIVVFVFVGFLADLAFLDGGGGSHTSNR